MRPLFRDLALVLLVALNTNYLAAQSPPSISAVTPPGAPVGALVTIAGTNFGATQGTSTVTFNGTTATPTTWSDSSITVPVPTGATTGSVVVTVGGSASNGRVFAVATSNFTLTGSLNTARMFQTSTLLDNGMVLIAGGVDGFDYNTISSAELYNPTTATFTPTGSLNMGRIFNTATLLNSGKVLIVGGTDSNWNNIATAELYDPVAGTFSITGSLNTARDSQTATVLNNGKVLIVGGVSSNGDWITALAANAEIYDPVAGTFSSTGGLNTARDTHTATLLNNGQVLIVGGLDVNGNSLASAELYDPTAGTFTLTGSLSYARAVHTASLLNNGMVLIVGGYDTNGNAVANAELYNPATATFTVTGSMNTPRYDMGDATLLSNGMVLIAGGQDTNGNTIASVEVYDPAAGTFSVTGGMNSTRQSLTTTLLPNGQVLIAAGMDYYANVLTSVELYQPSSLAPPALVSIAVSPQNPTIAVGTSQQFIATGTFSDNSTQTLVSATWSSSATSVATVSNDASNYGNALGVAQGTATISACAGSICGSTSLTVPPPPSISSLSPTAGLVGSAVTIGGTGFGSTQGSSMVTFNAVVASPTSWSDTAITVTVPAGATTGNVVVTVNGVASNGVSFAVVPGGLATTGALGTARLSATATLLVDGSVLIVGGLDSNNNALSSAEIYDPAAGAFTAVGSLNTARAYHTATLLSDGTVLIVGGQSASYSPLASAELYDPATATFSAVGNLNLARQYHTATLLNNGTVLIAGGQTGGFVFMAAPAARASDPSMAASAEIYNPAAHSFTASGSLSTPRDLHTATLLDNGTVLIAGGMDANYNALASAEIYDPTTSAFTVTGSLNTARDSHTAALLNNGTVLIAGGMDSNYNALSGAEIYDPAAATFTVTGSLNTPRLSHAMTLLNNGAALVAAGWDTNGNSLGSLESYDPAAGAFTGAGSLSTPRAGATATLLGSGSVLFAGGMDNNGNVLASAELYQPGTFTPPGLVSIALNPLNPSLSVGAIQQFTATGTFSDNSTETLASAAWTSSASPVATVTNDASNHGNAFGVAPGTATISACTGSVCASTTLTVSPAGVVPDIISLSPESGMLGSWVAIEGVGFGATQGASTVQFGGNNAAVVSWADSAAVAAVPSALTPGQTVPVAVTTAGGTSNSMSFQVLLTAAAGSYRVSPQTLSLLVGQSRTVSVTDASGNVVTGLVWRTSNPAIVTLSSDDPPLITGVAPGSAVVYAAGLPIPVTVYAGSSLPSGTPIWSAPVSSSMFPTIAIPAVPSASGADLLTLDDYELTAFASDGSSVWQLAVGRDISTQLIPDFSGSALVTEISNYTDANGSPHSTHVLQGVNPTTHQVSTLYTFSDHVLSNSYCYSGGVQVLCLSDDGATQTVIPHPSGVVFVLDAPPSQAFGQYCDNPTTGQLGQCQATVSVLNPATGQTLASIPLENAMSPTDTVEGPALGSMIVAGDGNAYLPYSYFLNNQYPAVTYLMLLRVSPDGSFAKVQLDTGTVDSSGGCTGLFYPYGWGPGVITNAATGVAVFATLTDCASTRSLQISYVSQDSVTSQVTGAVNAFVPALQREDGSYIGTDGYMNLIALGLDGSVLWQQTVGTAPITPLYATADGGAIVTSTTQCQRNIVTDNPCSPSLGTLYTLDANGNVTSQAPDPGAVNSWTGEWTVASGSGVSDVGAQFDIDDASFASQQGGNPSQNGVAVPQCPCEVQSATTTTASNLAFPKLELAFNSADALGSTLPRLTPAPYQTQAYDFARPAFRLPRSFPAFNPASHQVPLPDFSVSRFRSRRSSFLAPQAAGGSSNSYLIMVGDPFDAGALFQLAADTQKGCLSTVFSGDTCSSVFQAPPGNLGNPANTITEVRVSSDQDFNNALVNNGPISGGVYYYGHGGSYKHKYSALFPGEAPGDQYNVFWDNYQLMSNAQLGANATITLRGCHAGQRGLGTPSIAQLIANRLNRPVYAWREGLFFSLNTTATKATFKETGISDTAPYTQIEPGTPVFELPWGGVGRLPCKFQPGQPEPLKCTGQ